MGHFTNKVIVITGASSGIGKALALQMADKNVQLILAARRLDELKLLQEECEKKGAACTSLFIDLASPDTISAFAETVMARFQKVDVLVNNAGVSQRSHAEEAPLELVRQIMEVNFFGQVHLTKALWPLLIKSAHANIVLMSSVVGSFGYPLRSSYAASKHALEGFFESWLIENKRSNIFFTTAVPGRINTNISYSALKADGSSHAQMDDGQAKGIKPETCAKKIIKAITNNKRKVYIAKQEMVLIFLRKFIPPLFFNLAKKLRST